ncbi:MAG: sporulation protein YqfD [Oscillospiraceae bacterium]|nr:sporulation protein YqfD [Oscillospiraceae bacterium]
MWKKVVAFLRGDVRVRASSTFPERILNICSARGIAFREPRFVSENELAFSVDRRDWRRLKAACADLGAEAHIDAVAGVPFLLGRLRRRYALLAGLGLCGLLLLASSCFIWDFQVEGNGDVPREKILRVLAKNGVRRGTFAYAINQHDLCNHALLELPELSWLTVNTRGCRATVIVRRRVPKPEIVNESAPTNVVARRDALVTEVRALDGEARVLPGTTVRAGQLLISGVVDTDGVEKPMVGTRYLAGKGEVWGRTWYELSTKIPLFAEVKLPGDEKTGGCAVLWGEKRVKFTVKEASNLSTECDKIIRRKQWELPGGLVLPVTWVTETLRPYDTVRVERTRQEAEALGHSALEDYLKGQLGADGEILSQRTACAAQGEWLLVTLSAECAEQIGVTVPIYTD